MKEALFERRRRGGGGCEVLYYHPPCKRTDKRQSFSLKKSSSSVIALGQIVAKFFGKLDISPRAKPPFPLMYKWLFEKEMEPKIDTIQCLFDSRPDREIKGWNTIHSIKVKLPYCFEKYDEVLILQIHHYIS